MSTFEDTVTKRHLAPMVAFDGGQFVMGSDHHYPEEAPARVVEVKAFALDRYAVTNAQFTAFVDATSYTTTAERAGLDGTPPGSMVFRMTAGPVSLLTSSRWWKFVPGAYWRSPEGPDSTIADRMDHPVVQISQSDAVAYAAWAGKRLPTEAEWELAASLSCEMSEVLTCANIWRGEFPHHNLNRKSPPFTVPVASGVGRPRLPINMIGNVWEWTTSSFYCEEQDACCGHLNQTGTQDLRVLKGGSFLCADSYCRRYRPQARIGQPEHTTTNHIGFRCAQDPALVAASLW